VADGREGSGDWPHSIDRLACRQPAELGVRREDLPALAARVKRNPDGTCGFYLPLSDSDILAIYESAYHWTPIG
jgi:hypothetical protein